MFVRSNEQSLYRRFFLLGLSMKIMNLKKYYIKINGQFKSIIVSARLQEYFGFGVIIKYRSQREQFFYSYGKYKLLFWRR